MALTQDQVNEGIRSSLAIARARRAQALNGQQQPALQPDRMRAALDRRMQRQPDMGNEPPVLTDLSNPLPPVDQPPGNGNGRIA